MFLTPIRNLLKSSSFRFALLTGFTIWLTTSVVLVAVYFRLESTLWNSIDHQLDERAQQLLTEVATAPQISTDDLVAAFNARHNQSATSFHRNNPSMMAMHNSEAMQAMHSAMGIASPPQHLMGKTQSLSSEAGYLQFSREVTLPNGEVVTISQNVDYLTDLQASLWQSLLFGLGVTLLIALFGAYWLTQRSLRRIHQINQACHTIIAGDFSHRIPYANPETRFDDYDQMAFHINRMLDEINELVVKVRQVSDNIAHDLKSPLARLRAQLETAYDQAPSVTLDNGITEVDRLLQMVKSLLGIARIESGSRQSFAVTDLHSLLIDVQEMYAPVFEDKAIVFSLHAEQASIYGDKHLLIQALANLLDNAYKFTPEGGRVSLASRRIDQHIQITIKDSGPGIDEQSLDKVFERFHREDSARNTSGFGLGLSLIKAIVTLHNGTIALSNDHGLCVILQLPVANR